MGTDADAMTPAERRDFKVELIITFALGLAAIVAAFGAYRSGLVGDEMILNFNEGIKASDLASQAYTEGNQNLVQDQALFLEFAKASASGDEALASYIHDQLMSEDLRGAVAWWQDQPDDVGTPFVPENPNYAPEAFARGEELDAASARHFELAKIADETTDRFDLVTVVAATVLFFLGLASVVRRARIKKVTMAVGLILLAISIVMLVMIELG